MRDLTNWKPRPAPQGFSVTGRYVMIEPFRRDVHEAALWQALGGAGINELGMIPRFLDLFDLDFFLLALQYTLLDHDTLKEELPYCRRRNVGIVIGGVFSSGIAATGAVPGAKYNYDDATPEVMERVRRIEAVCKAHGVPLAAAALQFPLGHPSVASVIPGAIHPDHVRQNVANFRHAIPASLWSDLKNEGLIAKDAPTPQ